MQYYKNANNSEIVQVIDLKKLKDIIFKIHFSKELNKLDKIYPPFAEKDDQTYYSIEIDIRTGETVYREYQITNTKKWEWRTDENGEKYMQVIHNDPDPNHEFYLTIHYQKAFHKDRNYASREMLEFAEQHDIYKEKLIKNFDPGQLYIRAEKKYEEEVFSE